MNLKYLAPASVAGLTLLAGSGPAFAGGSSQDCQSVTLPIQTSSWNQTVDLPRFDPGLGLLTSIEIELQGEVMGSASVESMAAGVTTVSTDFQAAITLMRPDNSMLLVATPTSSFVDVLGSFDGSIDFAGNSGVSHSNIKTMSTAKTAISSPMDLAMFSGKGKLSMPLSAVGSSMASGSGNLITQFLTDAGAKVSVCYQYELDCNGNGVPDHIDVSGLTPVSNDADFNGVPDECEPLMRSFCEGDSAEVSGGRDCPCGNNGAPGEGCRNGSGLGGLLSASGNPSVTADTLVLSSSQLPTPTRGFFMYSGLQPGRSQNGAGVLFGNGLRCLSQPKFVQKVVGGGSAPGPYMPPLSAMLGIAPGDTTYWQFWYRDRRGPCPGGAVNATNGLEIVWGL